MLVAHTSAHGIAPLPSNHPAVSQLQRVFHLPWLFWRLNRKDKLAWNVGDDMYKSNHTHTHTKIQCPRLKVHEMHKNACREHKTDIVCPQSIWVELPPDIPTGKVARLSTRVLQSLAMSPANVLHQQILPGNIVQATC